MSVYRYVKDHRLTPMPRSYIVSFFFMGIGGILLLWAIWPIVSFNVFTSSLLAAVTSPIGTSAKNSRSVSATDTAPQEGQDFTNANVWFPLKPQKKIEAKTDMYALTIPKLRIQNAKVKIGGEDLNQAIVHYGGTSLPGQNGNGALFGHSVLPQFFDPKNYKTIFSTLPTLTIGDDIYLTYDQITYRYKVQTMKVTSPEDLSMLEQDYDDAYITLVTCVPPGTYWQRLHVRAKLTNI